MQKKQTDWHWQWEKYRQTGLFLLEDWLFPTKLEDFRGKVVLDCGCGSGDHLAIVAKFAKNCVGVDLNAAEIARKNLHEFSNVAILEGDLAAISLSKKFDFVYSIGVLHHTDDPAKSFNNIKRFVKKDGRMIIWVYSYEGNFLNRVVLEFFKTHFLLKLRKERLAQISKILTAIIYVPVYTIYLLPLSFMPYYQYFQNWRKLSFYRNFLNVFDKANAPTTHFISEKEVRSWFCPEEFKDIHISPYKGVSWRASGTKI